MRRIRSMRSMRRMRRMRRGKKKKRKIKMKLKFKKSLFKDIKLRKRYYKFETILIILKALALNSILPISIRQIIYELIFNLSVKSTRIRNRCLYTGRARGIMTEFKMSRIKFRNLADAGLIPGVKRATW